MLRSGIEKLAQELLEEFEGAELRQDILRVLSGEDSFVLPHELTDEEAAKLHGPVDVNESGTLASVVRDLSVPEKIKLAIFGNQTARAILIRDRLRQIQTLVLQNPKLTETEVADFARNTNLDDLVYRTIGHNQGWMKNYAIRLGLISNPRVPIDISLRWVRYLQEKDLRRLAKSKGIPQVIASQCQKFLDRSSH